MSDEGLRKKLGLRTPDSRTQNIDAAIENKITGIRTRSQLMLGSSRLYSTVGFLRNENLLFRSDFELDDLLWMASAFVETAGDVLAHLKENAAGTKVRIAEARCRTELDKMVKQARRVSRALSGRAPATKKRKKKRKKT